MFTIGNAVMVVRATGCFLINEAGRTVFIGKTAGEAVRSAMNRNLKLVNNTSLKGLGILKKCNFVK